MSELQIVEECKQCGKEFKHIGMHWSQGSCSYPPLTEEQKEITTGLIMGDGYVGRNCKNPFIETNMISVKYLKYIDSKFGILGCGVSLRDTAAEGAKHARETGFSPGASEENYSDLYRWQSMSHPEFQEFADWYSSGRKVWPEDIELTPTVLKHWYCGDGYWNNSGTNNHIRITMSNEVDNTKKVDNIFDTAGLPSPNYDINDRPSGGKICNAEFTVKQSRKLWEYMGDPLPDFEYKWPEEYR